MFFKGNYVILFLKFSLIVSSLINLVQIYIYVYVKVFE